MLSTLQDRRLKSGDRVMVLLSSGIHQVEVVDSSDQSKIKVRLPSGLELWVGRRAVVDLVNEDRNSGLMPEGG